MGFITLNLATDVASLVTSINEVVTLSSSIFANDLNVKYFRNIASSSAAADLGGYFQTIYDSSPTGSTSTALLDITYGYSTGSAFNLSITSTSSQNEKIKIYRNMAQLLLGDSNKLFNIAGADQSECFFVLVKRGLQKDEIKKGATSIVFNTAAGQITGSDDNSPTSFVPSVGGDYAPLLYAGTGSELGRVYYNAGIVVLPDSLAWTGSLNWSGSKTLIEQQSSGNLNGLIDGFRKHVEKISFHNQTNLFSTVYFCRAFNSDCNYSSNPTFVDDNKRIRVTSGSNILTTKTYITTVGLYDSNDNLLAVAKVNKPISKSFDSEVIIRVRTDY